MGNTLYYKGKRALITGASSGIGEAYARALTECGASVVLVARRKDRLEKLSNEFGSSAHYIVADLSTEDGRSAVISFIKKNQIDILINNAGIGSFGFLEDQSITREAEMVSLNCIAPLCLTHAVIPQMKERKKGDIIFVSSIAAFQPLPLMSTYAATKAFNYIQSRGLAAELKPFGIRTMAVCPGPVATEFGGVARVPGTRTGGKRDSAELVASQTLHALSVGKELLVPGLRASLLSLLLRVIPTKITTYLVNKELTKVKRLAENRS